MSASSQALAALAEPANEPLNWLLGDFLREQAEAATGPRHFFLHLLESPRGDVIRRWNWWISECRRLVINSEILPQKVRADLKAGKGDVRSKVAGVIAEVFAVLHLSKLGYKNFYAVLPSDRSSPDFMAEFEGTPARVEVKNLAEPEDWITRVAVSRWEERSREHPRKYRFRAVLKHNSRGFVTEAAVKRLRTIVDQLPNFREPFEEALDGEIRVRFEKYDLAAEPEGFLEQKMHDQYRAKPHPSGYMTVITGIGPDNLQFNLGEFQALFLKALRVISAATPKFFSKGVDRVPHNVIALYWEVPDPFVDSDVPDIIGKEIGALLSNFGIQLKIVMFWQEPQVPLSVLRGS